MSGNSVNYNIDSEIAFIERLGKHCEEPKATRVELLMRYQVALHKRFYSFCNRRIRMPMETMELLEAAVAHELVRARYDEGWAS